MNNSGCYLIKPNVLFMFKLLILKSKYHNKDSRGKKRNIIMEEIRKIYKFNKKLIKNSSHAI